MIYSAVLYGVLALVCLCVFDCFFFVLKMCSAAVFVNYCVMMCDVVWSAYVFFCFVCDVLMSSLIVFECCL